MLDFKLIVRYLKLLLSNWVMIISAILGFVGVITTYKMAISIPYWIYLILLILSLVISGYNIYRKSSPKIVIETPNQEDVSIKFTTVYSNYFQIDMKSYITNYGLQSGSLEYISLHFISVNDIKDEFILNVIGIKGGEVVLSKHKVFPIFPTKQEEKRFNFPMIIQPDTIIPLYLRMDFSLSHYHNEETLRETYSWLQKVHFILEYKIKDSFGTEIINRPFSINVSTLPKLFDETLESRKKADEFLK